MVRTHEGGVGLRDAQDGCEHAGRRGEGLEGGGGAAEEDHVLEVAGGEGGGGIVEEGADRGGVEVEDGELQGSVALTSGGAQCQRVLANQEFDNGGVPVDASSVMKGRPSTVGGDGQQAPLPRVELGLRDHLLSEFQWRQV